MLADWAPSAWLASQTSHCAAAVVASSVLNAAVQARSRIAVVAERGLVVDDEQVAVEMGRAAECGEQVGGRGRDVGHRSSLLAASASWYGAHGGPSRPPPTDRGQMSGLTTIRNTIATSSTPSIMPPRWIRLTRASNSGGGPRAPGGGGDEAISMTRSTSLRWTKNE